MCEIKLTLGLKFLNPLQVQYIPPPKPSSEGRAIFTFNTGQFTSKGENMSNSMQTGSFATLAVQWVDAQGNPAKVDGPTTWASSDESILTVEVATGRPDGLIANVQSLGPIGNVQVQATADADMGSGVRNITAICDIVVIGGEAVAGTISFSQPNPNPPPKAK